MSYLASYTSPSISVVIAISGMAYPYLLVSFSILTIILFLLKKHKYFIVNIVIILLGWNNLTSWVQFNINSAQEPEFRIMSYNVKLFDLYNWKNNQKSKSSILKYISLQKPDIISFQEFYYDNRTFLIDSVSKTLDMPYYYVTDSRFLQGFEHFGQAIFSKYPIVEKKLIQFPNSTNMSLYCDIKISNDKIIRVFSNHLESYRFNSSDYELMEEITDNKTDVKKVTGLVERLELALVKRSYQASKVASLVYASPYPVIVTGDFNDTPSSYAYHLISKDLSDAFVESGTGFSHTYKGSFPSFRIDFILYSEPLESLNYKRLKFDASDHFPIYSDFIFKK